MISSLVLPTPHICLNVRYGIDQYKVIGQAACFAIKTSDSNFSVSNELAFKTGSACVPHMNSSLEQRWTIPFALIFLELPWMLVSQVLWTTRYVSAH